MKKFMPKLIALTMVITVLATCLAGCNNKKGPVSNSSTVNLDINPNIDLVIDKDNKVVSVVANNEDAEKLLINANVVGKDVDGAVETIVGMSVEAGYISEENNDVKVLAVDAKGKVNTKLMKDVATKVEEKAKAMGAKYIATVKEVTNSANRKLEQVRAELREKGDLASKRVARNLTAAKLHLAQMVTDLSDGAIALEEAIKMSVEELNQYIYDLSLEVDVVAKGAVAEIELRAANAVAAAQAEMAKQYEAFVESDITAKAALVAKNAYIDGCNGLIAALNKANEVVQQAQKDMTIAPKYNPAAYAPIVEGIANELFTEQADKDKFLKEATDKSVDHYTYKATIKALENAYDNVDKNNLTAEGLAGASIDAKLTEIETKYADDIKNIKDTMVAAVNIARKTVKATIGLTITAANAVNSKLGLAELAKPEEEFTTFDQLVVYIVKTINTQTASVEKVFNEKYVANLTDTQKQAVTECQAQIDNAKATAKQAYIDALNKIKG